MKKSDTGRNRHCKRELILMLLIWLLYCTNVVQNKLLENVKSKRGPIKIRSALLYGAGKLILL